MPLIEKSVLLPFSGSKMFALVERVEDYPQFLPWCGGSRVIERDATSMEATIDIRFRGVNQSFTTRNLMVENERIDMTLRDGPFSMLEGGWRFVTLREEACKVEFRLRYAFSNRVLDAAIGPVFHYIASSFIDSFSKRAEALYRP